MNETKGTFLQYSKSHLNKAYVNSREKQAIINVMHNVGLRRIMQEDAYSEQIDE